MDYFCLKHLLFLPSDRYTEVNQAGCSQTVNHSDLRRSCTKKLAGTARSGCC